MRLNWIMNRLFLMLITVVNSDWCCDLSVSASIIQKSKAIIGELLNDNSPQ